MNQLKNKDLITAGLFVILGLAIVFAASQLKEVLLENDSGPRLFPYIYSIGLILCGMGIFFKHKNDSKPFLDKEGWRRVASISMVIISYAVLLYYAGFLISTPILVFVATKIMGRDKISNKANVIFSILMTASVYYTFVKVLDVILPSGKIF